MSKEKNENWGGPRTPGPGKTLGRPRKADKVKAKSVTVRFYTENLADVQALINAGYGTGLTDVIRRALREAVERL